MNQNFTIKPELLKLITLLKDTKILPSTLKLCEQLQTTENKVRTMQKELLYFKFIYSLSSSGYAVNTWTRKILNCDYKLSIQDNFYIFSSQTNSYFKIQLDLFENIFKTSLDIKTNYDASFLLYFFIVMSKSYKCIHENTIFTEDGNLVLQIDVLKYKTQIQICGLKLRFTDKMQWKS